MTTKGGLVGHAGRIPQGGRRQDRQEVWSFNVDTGIVAPPISWEQDGEQYIGVASGWGGRFRCGAGTWRKVNYLNQGGSMWVFKLHKRAASRAGLLLM